MTEKRPLTFTLFLLRLLSGIAGGVAGTLMAFVVYFILSTVIPAGEEATSLSTFTIIIMVFVGTLVANTVTAVMLTFMDSQKYSRRKTTITHVFIFNIVLFILTILFYLLAAQMDIVIGVAAIHLLLSAFVTALILEILAGYEYSLLGVYSVSLGTFLSLGLGLAFLSVSDSTFFIVLGAMPTVWFILMIIAGFTELIYDNFLQLYGVDALNTKTDLGGDNEVEPEPDEDEDEEDEDEDEEDNKE